MKNKVKLGGNRHHENKSKKSKLQLKGRIFVQNVTNVNKFQDNKTSPTSKEEICFASCLGKTDHTV